MKITRTVVAALLWCLLCPLAGLATGDDEDSAAYHFALAKLYAAEGQYEEAETHLEQAIELDADSVVLRVDYAQMMASLRRWDEARTALEGVLAEAPDDIEALRSLGQVLWTLGRDQPELRFEARDVLEKLHELAPDDLQGAAALAQLYEQTDQLDKAIEVYRRLASNHVDNSQIKRLLVQALSRAGRNDEARGELQEMLRIEQASSESRMTLAELEAEKGNHTEAIRLVEEGDEPLRRLVPVRGFLAEQYLRRASSPGLSSEQRTTDLETALEIVRSLPPDEKGPGLFRLEGTALRRLGRSADALQLYETLVRERGGSEVWPHLLLSGLLETMQRYSEASEVLEAARTTFDGTASTKLELTGRLLWLDRQRGAWPRVLMWSDQLLAASDGQTRLPVVELRVEALSELGRADEALRLVRQEKKRSSGSGVETLSLLEARVLSDAERPKDALRLLRSSVLAESSDPGLLLQSARLLRDLDQEDEAMERISRFADQDTLESRLTAGQFFSAVGRFEAAVPHLERALEVALESTTDGGEGASPQDDSQEAHADVRFWLGQALERTGQVEEAARQFREVLKVRPDDTTTMNYLGYMWAEAGIELDSALQLVERAVQIEPDNGSYVDSLGWALFRLGRLEEAQLQLERAAELSPGNAVILEHLGDVLQARGKLEDAVEFYRQAAELDDPDNASQVTEKLESVRALLDR